MCIRDRQYIDCFQASDGESTGTDLNFVKILRLLRLLKLLRLYRIRRMIESLQFKFPHAVFFIRDVESLPVAKLGREVELDPLFPEKVNAGFAQIYDASHIRLRVWERGAGLTAACGTGACAALVAAHRRGLAARKASIMADGGELIVEWREADNHVILTGPVEDEGEIELAP